MAMKRWKVEVMAVALGASIGLNVAVISLERWNRKRYEKSMKDMVVVTDMALASYEALKIVDPVTAEEIAMNTRFGFIINDQEL